MLKRRWKKLRFFGGCAAGDGGALACCVLLCMFGWLKGVLISMDVGRGVPGVLLALIVCGCAEGSRTIVASSSKFICSEGAV